MTKMILVQPMYSKAELNSDSTYVLYSALIRAMRVVRPDWHFIVLFPDDKSGYKYESDGFFNLPNVTRLPQRISTRKMANAISYDGAFYDLLLRELGVDVVWCHLVEIAGHIMHAGDNPWSPAAMPVMVAEHDYVIHESLPFFKSQQHVAWAQLGGAKEADHNVFISQHTRTMFIETAQRWLSESTVAEILQRSSTIPLGTLEQSLTPRPRKNAVPVIIYNHRLQSYKNYRETFELLDELYAAGVQFRVRFTNSSAEKVAEIAGRPYVEIKLCATRALYLDAIAVGDLNVTNSAHETFCISAVESMALGQPLVAPDGVTFPEITGRDANGYPYLYRNRDEQRAMLTRLLTDPAERQRWGSVLSSHVRSQYTAQRWASRYAELFESLEPPLANTPADVLDMVRSKIAANSGGTLRELRSSILGTRVGGRAPLDGRQSLAMVKLMRMARALGARVELVDGVQRVWAKG